MNIKRFALAAADEIDEASCFDEIVPSETIERHMQAAVDEATAPLRARIAELEGLGPLIDDLRELTALHADYMRRGIDGEALRWRIELESVAGKIDTTLKGGAL